MRPGADRPGSIPSTPIQMSATLDCGFPSTPSHQKAFTGSPCQALMAKSIEAGTREVLPLRGLLDQNFSILTGWLVLYVVIACQGP